MNEIIKAMKERRSIRKFKAEMPPKEMIEQVIDAGLYAASGKNEQAVITIAVTNKEFRDKLMKDNRDVGGWAESYDPFYGAPVILIVLGRKSRITYVYDGSLVIGNMMLAAHSLGLGSIWIHRRAWHRRRMGRHRPLYPGVHGLRTARAAAAKRRPGLLDRVSL